MRSLRALTLLGLGLTFATPAHATKQCFYSSGKALSLIHISEPTRPY